MIEPLETSKLIRDTTERQMRAAKPDLSAWVSANAGSGKTHVLSQRVIRLLLDGTRPSSILCLTYTKAAAAEMSNRVFKTLSQWTQLDDKDFKTELEKFEGFKTTDENSRFARTLFASALETPGGLKVQTIHAFCEALLHKFPLEANVSGHFEVLDDASAEKLLKQARDMILSNVAKRSDADLADAIEHILDVAGEHGLEELFQEIISERAKLSDFIDFARANGGLEHQLSQALDIDLNLNIDDIYAEIWPLPGFDNNQVRAFYDLAYGEKNKSPQQMADCLISALNAQSDEQRLDILKNGFLTQSGAPRSLRNVVSKAMQSVEPELVERFSIVLDHVISVDDKIRRRLCIDVTLSALMLAGKFIQIFEDIKRRQSRLDYDDLILKTAHLLNRGGAGGWVNYKLDQGIDHILVDEAQDTSPDQWSVIQSLAGEFNSGLTSRDTTRTIFAVGDEKQSIYSFQGARPERFDQERRATAKKTEGAQKQFASIGLRVSFRSTHEVLQMVDHVFDDDDAKSGLSFSEDSIVHHTVRDEAPGSVELWDMLIKDNKQTADDWLAPIDSVSELDPINQLSLQIASVLKSWIGHEVILDQKSGSPRKVQAGDILILVRKRDGFVPTLIRTLKSKTQIPVAGTDRLRLTDHMAVQDLLVLAKVVVLKEDDLSLAGLLKSPIFDIGEDKLFDLTAKRAEGISVWAELKTRANEDGFWQEIYNKIIDFTKLSDENTVHDFFSHILGPLGVRQLYLDRMGSEVTDILDGLLDAALDHDQDNRPGLQNFTINMEQTNLEIKREQEQDVDAVRIMTVHASKGLEAPIVFLVDPGSAPFHSSHGSTLFSVKQPDHLVHQPAPFIWVPTQNIGNSKSAELKQHQEMMIEQEYRRLLYVGMTRAADRLIVCGYRGSRASKKVTWHQYVEAGFDRAEPEMIQDIERECEDFSWSSRSYSRQIQVTNDVYNSLLGSADLDQAKRPKCLGEMAKPSTKLPRPLVPSGVNVTIEEGEQLSKMLSPFEKANADGHDSLNYGNALHRLLQVLPQLPSEQRQISGLNYLKNALPNLSSSEHLDIIKQVELILNEPEWAPVFGDQGASEFSVMGSVDIKGEIRAVFGRIDRLAVLDDQILIIDYKTNMQIPGNLSEISSNYIAQLALYREILRPLYQNKPIHAALLYTRGPRIFTISEKMMDAAMAHLCSK